jgi:hypothetical protein
MNMQRMNIRLPIRLYAEIKDTAAETGISMNALIIIRLAEAVSKIAADPRTPEQRERDAFAAEVLDTQESDRP